MVNQQRLLQPGWATCGIWQIYVMLTYLSWNCVSQTPSPTQFWVSMDHTGILCELGKKKVKQHLKGGLRVPGGLLQLLCVIYLLAT